MLTDYDPCAKWYKQTWQLSSDDLYDKWGFDEGNLFIDLCLDNEINSWVPEPKVLLKLVVEHFLLPKIHHAIAIIDANTSHNTVRAADDTQGKYQTVEICITGKQIFEMLSTLK